MSAPGPAAEGASSQQDLSLHQELIKSLRLCSWEWEGEGMHKPENAEERQPLEHKAMPGALAPKRQFPLWHLGWKMNTEVVCTSSEHFQFDEEKSLH